MNKKIIPLLLIVPVLASCKGVVISNEDALNILKNIETLNKETPPFENFSETKKTVTENMVTEEKSCFNKEQKFFYHYKVTTTKLTGKENLNTVSENWTYVKDGNIYDISRDTSGEIIPGDNPVYLITKKVTYKDEVWSQREKVFVDNVNSYYSTAIGNSRNFIIDEEIDVTFTSSNPDSIYVSAAQKIETSESLKMKYEYFFENKQLKLQNKDDGQVSEKFEWTYGNIETNYPNVQEEKTSK